VLFGAPFGYWQPVNATVEAASAKINVFSFIFLKNHSSILTVNYLMYSSSWQHWDRQGTSFRARRCGEPEGVDWQQRRASGLPALPDDVSMLSLTAIFKKINLKK
jgi:hypothetical protein